MKSYFNEYFSQLKFISVNFDNLIRFLDFMFNCDLSAGPPPTCSLFFCLVIPL